MFKLSGNKYKRLYHGFFRCCHDIKQALLTPTFLSKSPTMLRAEILAEAVRGVLGVPPLAKPGVGGTKQNI